MGRRRLGGHAVRMLGSHAGIDGKAFRRGYNALCDEFGAPPSHGILRLEMSRAAVAWTTLEAAQRRLAEARRRRETLKTHRPSESMILRLEKRAGLADESYSRAVDRVRELAGARRSATPDELLARADEALRRDREARHAAG